MENKYAEQKKLDKNEKKTRVWGDSNQYPLYTCMKISKHNFNF